MHAQDSFHKHVSTCLKSEGRQPGINASSATQAPLGVAGPQPQKRVFMWKCSAHRVELLTDILKKTPQARGRLLVDLINEPDGYSLTWDVSSLTTLPLAWGNLLHSFTTSSLYILVAAALCLCPGAYLA